MYVISLETAIFSLKGERKKYILDTQTKQIEKGFKKT